MRVTAPARAHDQAGAGRRRGGRRVRPGGPGGVRHRADGQIPVAGGPGGSPARSRPPRARGGFPRAEQVVGARQGPGPARYSAAVLSRAVLSRPAFIGPALRRRRARRARRRSAFRAAAPAEPTNVYSPGGLIDLPGDSRAPGTPDGQDIPEILRTAGPGPAPGGPVPGAHAGGRGQDRPPPGRAGPQPPRPGYPPGMNPAAVPAGRHPARAASRASHAARVITDAPARRRDPATRCPGRDGVPGREPFPPRDRRPGPRPACRLAPPARMRPARTAAAGPRRPAAGHAVRLRDSGPVPRPRTASRRHGTRRTLSGQTAPCPRATRPTRRHGARVRAVPRIAPPDGMRAAPDTPPRAAAGRGPPGHAGAPGHRGPAVGDEPFDGGYAQGHPRVGSPGPPGGPGRPPGFGRPAEPAPASPGARPADVFVYRDTGDQPGGPAATGPDRRERRRLLVRPARAGRRAGRPGTRG